MGTTAGSKMKDSWNEINHKVNMTKGWGLQSTSEPKESKEFSFYIQHCKYAALPKEWGRLKWGRRYALCAFSSHFIVGDFTVHSWAKDQNIKNKAVNK